MRKILFLLFFTFLFSCEKNETNDLLPDVSVSVTVNMELPSYISLQTIGGYSYIENEGIKGIIVVRRSTEYKAFDRACPNNDCQEPMTYNGLKLKCSCDDSEYSILDGSPQTSGNSYFAREYRVTVNGSYLQITNF